jgi:hypothetical protein
MAKKLAKNNFKVAETKAKQAAKALQGASKPKTKRVPVKRTVKYPQGSIKFSQHY